MTVKIEDLMSDGQYLIDATDAELSELNGGYVADVGATTGDPLLAAEAGILVAGRPVSAALTVAQLNLGVPTAVVIRGDQNANSNGNGVYTFLVTAASLRD